MEIWIVYQRAATIRVFDAVQIRRRLIRDAWRKMSWDDPAHFSGFSPRPTPKLIATARLRGPALAISKGIERDRAVDESGNQLAVFGRRSARPLNRSEAQAVYLRNGQLYTVTDEPAERMRLGRPASASDTLLRGLQSWLFRP